MNKNHSHQKRNPLLQQYNPSLKQESIYYNNIITKCTKERSLTMLLTAKQKEETICWDDSRLPRTTEALAWVVWSSKARGMNSRNVT